MTRDHTKLKLRHAWLVRLFRNKGDGESFSEFVLETFERKVEKSGLVISRLQSMLERIISRKESKVSLETRMKILASTQTAQNVLVTDLESGITTTYPSARNAAIALNASGSTIMNKINGRNTRLFKGRYLITGIK